ncbi:MAG: hypothetical protein HPY70_00850 [Firmicutes bacterium]|nr:hypothetical protein [Bacillota bacterium]
MNIFNRSRILMIFMVFFIFSITLFIKFFVNTPFWSLEKKEPNEQEQIQAGEDIGPKVEAGTIFSFETYYTECGHTKIVEERASEMLRGYSFKDLSKEFPEWEIKGFEENKVTFYKYVNGLCPDHYFIGIKDGFVALFYGRPGTEARLKEITEIKVELLRDDDRRLLEQGIEVYGEEELMRIKEGLTN